MRALMPFLACLMLVLAGWSAMAHAAEPTGGRAAGIELSLHQPGDGDEVPGDGDNALPHHHNGCHAHDLGTPAMAVAVQAHAPDLSTGHRWDATRLAGLHDSVLPRPPRA
ncbi:hypothetical protein ASE67_15965 [Sphingomonas sp. Leaf23]|uniref:hypothetical protein n=1 Tax=Sphingomonas sp. Leaf23 TaxID=1735689 RepID=UPI0007010B30|nr:hypothetical protein [Sphingomonas sp. Leaf23]KQM85157.1 hypothetical protein ASE67_15965 [Sphingomonas sp. Leaf23]